MCTFHLVTIDRPSSLFPTCCSEYLERKQWQAVEVAGGHLKELILLVLAMLDHGDEVRLRSSCF